MNQKRLPDYRAFFFQSLIISSKLLPEDASRCSSLKNSRKPNSLNYRTLQLLLSRGGFTKVLIKKLFSVPVRFNMRLWMHSKNILSRLPQFKHVPLLSIKNLHLQNMFNSYAIKQVVIRDSDSTMATLFSNGWIKFWRNDVNQSEHWECVGDLLSQNVESIAFDTNSSDVAVVSEKNFFLYSVPLHGKGIHELFRQRKCHSDTVICVGFCPHAPIIATGSKDGKVKLWNRSSSGTSMDCKDILEGHSSWVVSLEFHKTDPILATGSRDKTIKLWRMTRNGTLAFCVATLTGHTYSVTSVKFHPNDPRILLSGSEDNTAMVWKMSSDYSSVTSVTTLEGHSDSIHSVAFHPKNDFVVTVSEDFTAKIWDIYNGSSAFCVATLYGHMGSIYSVALHQNGDIVTGSEDRTVKFWRPF